MPRNAKRRNIIASPKVYLEKFLAAGGIKERVVNWLAHYYDGTAPETLAKASQRSMVYNPQGH